MTAPRLPLIALEPHACAPPSAIDGVAANCFVAADAVLAFRYRIRGELGRLNLPKASGGQRCDGLWEHTCCEAFIATGGGRYLELNFAPNGDWAAYGFSGYRERGIDPPMQAPAVRTRRGKGWFDLEARVDTRAWLADDTVRPLQMSLAAVVEEHGDRRSYWALCHPRERPDFHDADGFTLQVALEAI